MDLIAVSALWIAALAVALGASELLVHNLSLIGARTYMAAGLLGVLVALGADAPEVTSALVAFSRGSADVGLGVVLGSNIYNLAGLLGLSAVLAGFLPAGTSRLTFDSAVNMGLTILLVLLLLLPALHLVFGLLMVVLFVVYVVLIARGPESLRGRQAVPASETHPQGVSLSTLRMPLLFSLGAVVLIIAGSDALVQTSIYLGPRFGLSTTVVGAVVLGIATSLPNTWAAVSLTRRQMAPTAIATTFNSNSINAVVAVAAPSIVLALHVPAATGPFDAFWLLAMTALAMLLLARHGLSRLEGGVLLVAYAAFAVIRVGFLH